LGKGKNPVASLGAGMEGTTGFSAPRVRTPGARIVHHWNAEKTDTAPDFNGLA
jgi:hypothetical protein